MLKVALFLLALAILLVPRYPVYAQSTATRAATPKPPLAVQRAAERVAAVLPREDKVASRGALLRSKLAKFRDQKKAKIVERIDMRLASISASRSAHMAERLNRMSNILDKLEAKIAELAGARDMSEPQAAISQARTIIASAQSAVEAQKLKEYTVEATSEANIKQEIVSARTSLHTDLNNVHGMIVQARQAVAKAISTTVSTLKGGSGGSQ